MSSDDDDMEYFPEEEEDEEEVYKPLAKSATTATVTNHSIHPLTIAKYNSTYVHFKKWMKTNGVLSVAEKVLLDFFTEIEQKSKPSTLWAYYSMLKTTLKSKDNIDISTWTTLTDYLKLKNIGYKPAKAKVFTKEEIDKFIDEAPDDYWLDIKVRTTPIVYRRKKVIFYQNLRRPSVFLESVAHTIQKRFSPLRCNTLNNTRICIW